MQVQDDKPYDEINITPMLDLAYVLLIMFILMCTTTVQGLKASLPRGSNAPAKKQKENKIQSIQVDSQGKIFLNREGLSLQQLEGRLKAAKMDNPKVQVVLKGESVTRFDSIVQVLNIIGRLEIQQVGLATITR